MADVRRQETYLIDNNGDAQPEGVDHDQEQSYDEFRSASDGASGGMNAWVYKVPEDVNGAVSSRGQMEHLFTEPIDRYTLDEIFGLIRQKWMLPSDQRWMIRVMIREGNRLRLNKIYSVRKATQQQEGAGGSKPSEIAQIIDAMMRENRRVMGEFLSRLPQAGVAPAQQPMDMMAFFKFMNDSRSQDMQSMAALIGALRPAQGGTSDLMSMLGAMGKIREVASDLLPQAGESDSTLGTIKALSPFAVLIAEAMKRRPDAAPTTPLLPGPTNPAPIAQPAPPLPPSPPESNPSTSVADDERKAKMLGEFREQLKMLAEIAGNKPDVKEVAATLLPMLPEEMDDMIYDTLSDDNWFDRLCFIQGAIKPHREWFSQLRDELLASFKEVDSNATEQK